MKIGLKNSRYVKIPHLNGCQGGFPSGKSFDLFSQAKQGKEVHKLRLRLVASTYPRFHFGSIQARSVLGRSMHFLCRFHESE